MKEPQHKNKGGRPLKPIDWKVFDGLCRLHCTEKEIASFLGVAVDTLDRACKREHGAGFKELYEQKAAGGKASLRRMQWKLAEDGHPTMLIWLGKQYLGQRDESRIGGELTVNLGEAFAAAVARAPQEAKRMVTNLTVVEKQRLVKQFSSDTSVPDGQSH